MINTKIIFRVLGSLLFLETLLLLLCLGLGIFYGETDYATFALPSAVTLALALLLKWLSRGADNHMSRRDGYLIVSVTWVVFSLVGMLPFLIGGSETRISAAFFETMSGFTTTGATALANIDTLPHSILFWRSLTHWFGGMGIVFFTIAVLPNMGAGNLKLFSAEATGLKMGRLHPRISTTARWIWGLYMLLTVACSAAYVLCGMGLFDAINHAMSTVATGGFSTRQASFAFYNSPTLEWVSSVFMMLGGINFALLYLLLIKRRWRNVFQDSELRCYLMILLIMTVTVAATLFLTERYGFLDSLRVALFNVTSLQTTTGFTSENYMLWPHPLWLCLLFVTMVGACAGSTSGGIKCIRVLTGAKVFINEFRRTLHPTAMLPVRLNNGQTIAPTVAQTIFSYFVAYFFLTLIGAVIYICIGLPMLDAFSISMTCLSSVGPACGYEYGPLDAWNTMPDAGMWTASFLMLAGRLEILTVLLPFFPAFWRDN